MPLRYISLAELINEIPDDLQGTLTDDTPNQHQKVEAILTQMGESAEEHMESYLSMRYSIPLEATDGTIPNSLKKAVFVIVKYFLYGRRDQIDAGVQAQYDTTIKWLKEIARGNANVNLLLADGSVASQGGVAIDVSPQTNSQFARFI